MPLGITALKRGVNEMTSQAIAVQPSAWMRSVPERGSVGSTLSFSHRHFTAALARWTGIYLILTGL